MNFVLATLLLTAASCHGRQARQHAPPAELLAADNNIDNAAWADTFHAENVPHLSRNLPTINEYGAPGMVETHELRTAAPSGWFGIPSPINRQSLPAAPSFFALAPQYVVGLVTTFAFVLGVILLFDLIFGEANIIERITGVRGAKAIKDMVTGLDVNSVMDGVEEVYTAIEKYQDLQKSQLPK